MLLAKLQRNLKNYFKTRNMKDVNFLELNQWFWGLNDVFHIMAMLVVIMCYTHLAIGFYMVRKKLKQPMYLYFFFRTTFYFSLLFLKFSDDQIGIFDAFLPIYIFAYIDGLIILKTNPLMMCKSFKETFSKIFKFNTYVPRK